jgi:hypothetical protein
VSPPVVCDSEIVAIGASAGVTVTCADPVALPAAAVIVIGPPAATPVTTPVDDTVATAAFDVVHVVTRFVQFACVIAAVSGLVAPATTVNGLGVTTMALTTHCGSVTEGPSPPPPQPRIDSTRSVVEIDATRT